MDDLRALFAHRAEQEAALTQDERARREREERTHRERIEAIESTFDTEAEHAQRLSTEAREAALATYQREHDAAKKKFRGDLFRLDERGNHDEIAAKKALREAIWTTDTVYEAKQGQPGERHAQFTKFIKTKRESLRALETEAERYFEHVRQRSLILPPVEVPPTEAPDTADPTAIPDEATARAALDEHAASAAAHLQSLTGTFGLGLFRGIRPFVIALILTGGGAGIMLWRMEGRLANEIAYAAAGGLACSLLLFVLVYFGRRGRLRREYAAMRAAIAAASAAGEQALLGAAAQRRADEATLLRLRNEEIAAARTKFEPLIERVAARRKQLTAELDTEAKRVHHQLKSTRDETLARLDAEFAATSERLHTRHEQDRAAEQERHLHEVRAAEREIAERWSSLVTAWREGLASARHSLDAIHAAEAALFPAWSDAAAWRDWTPPTALPPAIRFGTMTQPCAELPGGLPVSERLPLDLPSSITLPALLDFPTHASLLVETRDAGNDRAVELLQAVMLRLLTSLPPGKARFTIIDPLGLGQNFAGFMHLADYDESFVASRIWTETRHIEQRLTDLTEHMENVIQKYLRNEYDSIASYNEHAGEIAEPFRFLIIANFPANFNEQAARRLASIVESGPRCGVFTLVSHDTRLTLPTGFQLDDLRRHSVNLVDAGGRFILNDEAFRSLPLELDPAPGQEFLTRVLHLVGASAKDASRVEVPFEMIAPSEHERWRGDATSELRVPLGQSGATKRQHIALGRGTSQHALIAGRTGSGKSTLLHVLITSVALRYRPDEVELYLVDFKKGVEFKPYAAYELPHARAVAIESDREFGLSVLQRLDAELKRRGELFRDAGTQDVAGFRRERPDIPMPRVLLVIDEFQEFFTEDDRLAQEASLLLDRLVRQGRAFGLHVLLGSQTLAGAYSLARSTISQMAVRVALQCSEADAGLIMSDDNLAARLLSRPGEAIYNDQSGLIEGNSPFQIVWLPDEKREQYLALARTLAKQHDYQPPAPQIVFEGNVPADLGRNRALERILADGRSAAPAAAHAWLGEPIAIREPVAAIMRRQSGANLLIVGQREEAALGMMASAVVGLAAHHDDQARFLVLDATPPDDPGFGRLEQVLAHVPQEVRFAGWRDAPALILDAANEVDRRIREGDTSAPAWHLVVFGLHRFRDLRRSEDDFSFSADPDKPPAPDKRFAHILREGPGHGVHALIWCDTGTNLNRSIDRGGLREFDTRVLFQMNASDSSNLVDSPLAEKLGPQRALVYREEFGMVEKFRPYALPDRDWLRAFAERLRALAAR